MCMMVTLCAGSIWSLRLLGSIWFGGPIFFISINIFNISVSIQGSEPILGKGMSNTKRILRRLLYRVFDCLIFRSI